jgi:hypothetical protein
MNQIVDLADRRPPVHYTIRLTHHWDGRIEVFVEDVADDGRSRAAVGAALSKAAEAWGAEPQDAVRLALAAYIDELLSALAACVASLRGYRREHNESQACDAERAAASILAREGATSQSSGQRE